LRKALGEAQKKARMTGVDIKRGTTKKKKTKNEEGKKDTKTKLR